MRSVILSIVAAGLLVGAPAVKAADSASNTLSALSGKTVLFGHQSVGLNIMGALAELNRDNGSPLVITEIKPGEALPRGTFGHAMVPENGKPDLKLESFAKLVDASPDPDIAFMKFCYVDFDTVADPDALFARYKETVEALKSRHPRTVFVHVTTPLKTAEPGLKNYVKALFGTADWDTEKNVVRERYNQLMRDTYKGREPLFDLALVESTRPDGARETTRVGDIAVPSLMPLYSSDGGHLNATGGRIAASALLATLAAIPVRSAKSD
jgi:hypothetical protein